MSNCVACPIKKGARLLAREVLKSCVVDLRREGISHAQLSRCFSLNRTTSHRWEKSPPNQTLASLQETLLSAFERSEETYGSRRLSQAVTDLGIKVGRFKVRRLMRELAIKAKCPKAKVWRKQTVDFAENIANAQCAMMPNALWAGDITYIPTDEGWLYLAVVIDWFSRLIVGWSVSDIPDSRLCIQALQLAIHRRKPPSEVIFHSDRGSQYSSQAFRNVLTEAKMVHSQSRARKCTDNAVTERFFRSLKSEKLNGYRFRTREQALLCVAEYIEDFYNPRRLHSALRNRSPMQFEMDCLRA